MIALVGILGAFALQRYIAIRNAVHAYKSAFSDCASAIANNSFDIDTFANDLDRHRAAVDAIRPILPKRYQRKLQKAWDQYCGKGNGGGFSDKEFVAANGAFSCLGSCSENREIFKDFLKSFNTLHGCLDDLL
jgi:hypothetical protein